MTLDELMTKHGTDKGSTEHDYGPIYEEHFDRLRAKEITLLELGVWQGASLKVWRDYFPAATIIGLDQQDRGLRLDGVEQMFSDQNNPNLPEALANAYGGLDIIIDDASHISSKTIGSFKLLWPVLKPGGIYVIEDLQTSYDPVHYGHKEASVDPRHHPLPDGLRATQTAMHFCKSLADEVNAGLYEEKYRLGFNISRVTFGLNICFITKAS